MSSVMEQEHKGRGQMRCRYGWIWSLRPCRIIITILLALAALPALAEHMGVDIAALLRSLSSDPHSNTSMMQDQESAAIAGASENVSRDKRSLNLRLRSGKQLALSDSKECGATDEIVARNCISFIYLGHYDRAHLYEVLEVRLEGGNFLVIDDLSGAMWRLSDYPAVSPDGTRLAVFKNTDVGSQQGIEIWRRTVDSMTLEWSGDPFGAGPEVRTYYFLMGWISESEMTLRVVSEGNAEAGLDPQCRLTSLGRSTAGWKAGRRQGC